MRRALLSAGLALGLCGCSIRHITSGPPLPDVVSLQPGVSTKGEALAALGAPHVVRRQHDGDLLIWQRTDSYTTLLRVVPYLVIYERTRGDQRQDQLALLFDAHGVLSGVGETRDIVD